MPLFNREKRLEFSRTSIRIGFGYDSLTERVREILEKNFVIGDGVLRPRILEEGVVDWNRDSSNNFRRRSVFLELGKVYDRGIRYGNGSISIDTPTNDDVINLFIAYSLLHNVLADRDNKNVKRFVEGKVDINSVKVNDRELKLITLKYKGGLKTIEIAFKNVDRLLTRYVRSTLSKEKVFSVKLLPIIPIRFLGDDRVSFATFEGIVESRYRAVDGSLYTEINPVYIGVGLKHGIVPVEDENGNIVNENRIINVGIIISNDFKSMFGILKHILLGNPVNDSAMKSINPTFAYADTKRYGAYFPKEFRVFTNEGNTYFGILFEKKFVSGNMPDFFFSHLLKYAVVKPDVRVNDNTVEFVPLIGVSGGVRKYVIVNDDVDFVSSVVKELVRSKVPIKFKRPRTKMIIESEPSTSKDMLPVRVGKKVVGYLYARNLKEYIDELPGNWDKYARSPRTFRYYGILPAPALLSLSGLPLIPLVGSAEITEENNYMKVYSLLFVRKTLVPIYVSLKLVSYSIVS